MNQYTIVDGHADSLSVAYDKKLSLQDPCLMFNIKEASRQRPYLQFLATFIHTKYVIQDPNIGYGRGNTILDYFEKEYANNQKKYNMVKVDSLTSLHEVVLNGKLGILLSSENGAIIGTEIENIQRLYDRGIRVMGITWNDDNLLGCGCLTKDDRGLSKFGRDCIEKMNELHMAVDVSHVSSKTFYEILEVADHVVATHSNSATLCKHPRNLTDEQIIALAKKGGVIGICLYDAFLCANQKATIQDVVAHIQYMASLVGTNCIGIGTDFDGIEIDELPSGICGVKDINQIAIALEKAGFLKEQIADMMGDNWIRLLEKLFT